MGIILPSTGGAQARLGKKPAISSVYFIFLMTHRTHKALVLNWAREG